MAFLLDIFGDVKDITDNYDMAEVSLNISTKDKREYIILGGDENITVSSINSSVELPKCRIYTVKAKIGKCSKEISLQVPKGRCTRCLVVYLFICLFNMQ